MEIQSVLLVLTTALVLQVSLHLQKTPEVLSMAHQQLC
jgi:hypothetical protein